MAFLDTKTQKSRNPFELAFAKRCVHYFIFWVSFFGLYFLIPPPLSPGCRICLPICSCGLDLHVGACLLRERCWGLDCVQFGRGSVEGVGEPRADELWNVSGAGCAHRAAGGQEEGRAGAAASGCSTLTLCQQVESVIAGPGEGVRARTPITNHRLPPLGSWSRIVFLEGKHSNPSELSKSIHDSGTLPSPFGTVCVPGSELLLMYLLLGSFKISSFLYAVWGEKGLLLERRFQKWFWILSKCF